MDEKRLIDANALKRHMIKAMELANVKTINKDDIAYAIDNSHTVDAVEVVRCKDCKHYAWDEFDGCYVCLALGRFVKPDFWCAYGERKDNE